MSLEKSIALVVRDAKGGPIVTYTNMARAIADYVQDIHLFVFGFDKKRIESAEDENANRPSNNTTEYVVLPINGLKRYFVLASELLKVISRNDILVFSDTSLVGLALVIFAKLLERVTVFIPLGFYHREIRENLFKRPRLENALARADLKLCEPVIVRLAKILILPDHRMYGQFSKRFDNTLVLWPEFGLVDTDKYRQVTSTRTKYRRKLGLKASDVVIGYIGRLDSHSGFDLFLRTARTLIDEIAHVKFLVIGEGPLRPSLMDLTREFGSRVNYLGYVDHGDISNWIQTIDVALLPNREPLCGLSNVFLELLSSGVAVVTTPVGTRYIALADHSDFGLVVDQNPWRISSAIKKLVSFHKPDQLRRKRDIFVRKFSLPAYGKTFLGLINDALNAQKKRRQVILLLRGTARHLS